MISIHTGNRVASLFLKLLSKAGRSFFMTYIVVAAWVSASDAYVLSGTVTNNSGKTGRVYLAIDHYADNGTSIDTSGNFSISGVPSGTYTITAVMDTRGDGKLFASDPRGSSATFTVASADKSGIAITINNPPAPAPPTPSWMRVYPSDGGVGCRWDIKSQNDTNLPIADHYNFYWSTSPEVSPSNTAGGGSKPGVPDPGYGGFFLSGLNNGTGLYFVVTAVVNGIEGLPSPVVGPVTIGLPASGGVTVQGNASLSGFSPTGPLCIGLWGIDSGILFMKCFTSPKTVQPFQFNNVPDGYYISIASIDMNNNGIEDIGDVSVGSFPGTSPEILVQGAPVSGVSINIPGKSNDAGVFTEFNYPNGYSLFFMARNNRKLITNMTAASGPNINQPIDIHRDTWYEYWGFGLPGRPVVGSNYTLNLRYSDNSNETQTVAITDILDSYATPVYPSGSTGSLTPLMIWNAPSTAPIQNPFRYKIEVLTTSGTTVWENDMVPSNRTYTIYNEDGTATPLVSGTQYYWQVSVRDQNANRSNGPKVFFTPTATPARQLTVVSRNPASGVSIAVAPIDKNNQGSGSSPFTRFYDAGATVTLTAPATAGGNSFNNWSGCDRVSGTLCTVALSTDKTVSAIYSFLPPPPAGIITASGTGQVALNWSSVPGATSYNIYYSTTPGVTKANGIKIANVTSSYTVPSLTNGIPYYFVVTTLNANGEGAESAETGAVPGMPDAYTLADMTGVWQGSSIESSGPWWSRRTFMIASDGSFTTANDTASDGAMSPLSGNFSLSPDGIITSTSLNPSLRCNMDAGRTVIACTATNIDGKELVILTRKTPSYSQSDLTGNWDVNQIGTPGAHWLQGIGTVNPDGSSNMTYNSDNKEYGTLPGTITISTNGRISAQLVTTNPDTNYSDCSMDSGKTVIACVSTSIEHNESLLTIYTRKAAKYSQSDLTGTWAINSLAGPSSQWTRGVASVNADGSADAMLLHSGSTTPEFSTATLILDANGNTSVPGQSSSRCSMDAGKTVVICSGDWTAEHLTSEISVWTKTGSVPQNITGRWEAIATQGPASGVSGILLTQAGENITSTGNMATMFDGHFSNGLLTGSSVYQDNPFEYKLFLSADGKTLDGTVSTHKNGIVTLFPFTFIWKSNDPHNPDLTTPIVIATTPPANQTGVQRQNLVISVTWSKPVMGWDIMLVGKIDGVSKTIVGNNLVDKSKFSYNPQTNTLSMPLWPSITLDPNTTYTLSLEDSGTDIDWHAPYGIPAWTSTGNAYSFTFTTGNSLAPEKSLAVTLSGSGSGSVNSTPSGPIACSWPPQGGKCSTIQPVNTQLTLIATPGSDSGFGGWGGACSSCPALSCPVTIDSDKSCSSVFNVLPLIRLSGPEYYGSIIKAYAGLADGSASTMQAQAVEFTENVDLAKNIPLTLQGGYNSIFSLCTGFTTLHGTLTVSRGSLIADRLILR